MRVPPPPALGINEARLLADARARLEGRLPGGLDPADPAWLVLEQVAWMTGLLSRQLDAWPAALQQQAVHLAGGALRPALPAVNVVVVEAEVSGALGRQGVRFYAPQSETRDVVEFVPVEAEVEIAKAALCSWMLLQHDGLYRVAAPSGDLPDLTARWEPPRRAPNFDREIFAYRVPASDEVAKALSEAVVQLEARRLGWLRAEGPRVEGDGLVVRLVVDLDGVFARAHPSGVAPGGPLEGDWGTVEGVPSPLKAVREQSVGIPVLEHAIVGAGEQARPGIRLTGIPAGTPLAGLLPRVPIPTSWEARSGLWRALIGTVERLKPLDPLITRESAGGPAWVDDAIRNGLWDELRRPPFGDGVHLLHLRTGGALRLRLGLGASGELGPVTVWHRVGADFSPERTEIAASWRQWLRRADGRPERVHAYDLPTAGAAEILVAVPARRIVVENAAINVILVANLPLVRDGRVVELHRNVPETASLLYQDVVTAEVIDAACARGASPEVAEALRALPLARLDVGVTGDAVGKPLLDWMGVAVDACSGEVTFLAPDGNGKVARITPGTRVRLTWYRRTDGARGNVEADAIRLVEQDRGGSARVLRVRGPWGARLGEDRETPEAAIERMFMAGAPIPVTPADFERRFRQAVGEVATGWVVRVWTHAERSLFGLGAWPGSDAVSLQAWLDRASHHELLVVVGLPDGRLDDHALQLARDAIQSETTALARRCPGLRGVHVARFQPLTLVGAAGVSLDLPHWNVQGLPGELGDGIRSLAVTSLRVRAFYDAAVTRIRPDEGER